MTCRLFIDEVGNGDLSGASADDNVRYLSLTGVLTKRDLHDKAITPALNELKADVFGTTGIVLHRREIMRREKDFAVLRDDALGRVFDIGLLTLLRESPYRAMTVTIDKRAHLETYGTWHFDPYHYCLRCLVERYVLWLRRHNQVGDVAIEPRTPKADKKVKASFRLIYDRGTEHISSKIAQQHLLSHDIKFIGKKMNIAGMQVCDLLAHPSYRSMKMKREGVPKPEDFGTAVADILEERRYLRHPQSMQIDGWGRKWLP